MVNNNAQFLIRALQRDTKLRLKEISQGSYNYWEFYLVRLFLELKFHLVNSLISGYFLFFYIQLNFNTWLNPLKWFTAVLSILMAGSTVGLALTSLGLGDETTLHLHSYLLHVQNLFSGSSLQISGRNPVIFQYLKSASLHFISFRMLFYVEFEWFAGGTCDFPEILTRPYDFKQVVMPILFYCLVFILVALVVGRLRFDFGKRKD